MFRIFARGVGRFSLFLVILGVGAAIFVDLSPAERAKDAGSTAPAFEPAPAAVAAETAPTFGNPPVVLAPLDARAANAQCQSIAPGQSIAPAIVAERKPSAPVAPVVVAENKWLPAGTVAYAPTDRVTPVGQAVRTAPKKAGSMPSPAVVASVAPLAAAPISPAALDAKPLLADNAKPAGPPVALVEETPIDQAVLAKARQRGPAPAAIAPVVNPIAADGTRPGYESQLAEAPAKNKSAEARPANAMRSVVKNDAATKNGTAKNDTVAGNVLRNNAASEKVVAKSATKNADRYAVAAVEPAKNEAQPAKIESTVKETTKVEVARAAPAKSEPANVVSATPIAAKGPAVEKPVEGDRYASPPLAATSESSLLAEGTQGAAPVAAPPQPVRESSRVAKVAAAAAGAGRPGNPLRGETLRGEATDADAVRAARGATNPLR